MKERENKEVYGYVYKVENIVDSSVYIGITTKDLRTRKNDHIQKMNNGSNIKFHKAIATFGEDCFRWDVIDSSFSNSELAEKEQMYIIEYDSKNNGLNGSKGGDFAKSVYQYSLVDGSLLNTYDTLQSAGEVVNTSKQCLSSVISSVSQTFGGYYWSYIYKEPFIPNIDKRKKKVLQMDFDGNMIATYISVAEASRQTGISKTCLSRVCRQEREQTHGFVFKYK